MPPPTVVSFDLHLFQNQALGFSMAVTTRISTWRKDTPRELRAAGAISYGSAFSVDRETFISG